MIPQTVDDIKVEKCRALVSYCDVSGFMAWMQDSEAEDKNVVPFIQKMKWLFRTFREETGYFSIPIGDGIIVVVDAKPGEDIPNAFNIVTAMDRLQKGLTLLAADQEKPRPTGARVRITEGIVYRTTEPPSEKGYPHSTVDYMGEPMNLGSRLLQVSRETPAIMDQHAYDSLTIVQRKLLVCEPVKTEGHLPRGVKPSYMDGLQSFRLRNSVAEAERGSMPAPR